MACTDFHLCKTVGVCGCVGVWGGGGGLEHCWSLQDYHLRMGILYCVRACVHVLITSKCLLSVCLKVLAISMPTEMSLCLCSLSSWGRWEQIAYHPPMLKRTLAPLDAESMCRAVVST